MNESVRCGICKKLEVVSWETAINAGIKIKRIYSIVTRADSEWYSFGRV